MAERDQFDFNTFAEENLGFIVDSLRELPQKPPEVIAQPEQQENKIDPRWKRPDEEDKIFFGGLLHNAGLSHLVEDILYLDEEYKSLLLKVRFFSLQMQISKVYLEEYRPDGGMVTVYSIVYMAACNLKNKSGVREEHGIVFCKHPNLTLDQYHQSLSQLISCVNSDLSYVKEPPIPEYPAN